MLKHYKLERSNQKASENVLVGLYDYLTLAVHILIVSNAIKFTQSNMHPISTNYHLLQNSYSTSRNPIVNSGLLNLLILSAQVCI